MQFNNLSVVEFNNIIKNILDSEEMLFNCGVVGEISSFKITNNVAYFSLKDDFAVLNCVMFNPTNEYKIGEKVKVVGRPNYYVKGGKLNFNAIYITSFGEGEIYKNFLLLKEKLKQEGFFYNKKELPENVENIGVITSSKGAVLQDIISVTKRRNPMVNLFVFPVKVQGNNAEDEIVKGFEYFDKADKIDVIIVARGGGSAEDLSAFNTEKVARACYKSNKPVVSAVGHETDYTLLDLVADVRASTPSVAAEIAVKESKNKILDLFNKFDKIKNNMEQKINLYLNNFDYAFKECYETINKKVSKQNLRLYNFLNKISYLIKEKELKQMHLINSIELKLKNLNPSICFEKGFSLVEKDGKKIVESSSLKIGDEIDIKMRKGSIKAKVLKVE